MYYIPEPLNPKKIRTIFGDLLYLFMGHACFCFRLCICSFFRYYARARYGYPKDPGSSH